MRRHAKTLASLVLLAFATAACKQEPQGASSPSAKPSGSKITLAFNPKVGQRKLVTIDSKQIITQSPPGEGVQVINQEFYVEADYQILKSNPDHTVTAQIKYRRVKVVSPAGTGDSSANATITDRIYKACCKSAFEIDMAPSGDVKNIRGLNALYDAIGDAASEIPAADRSKFVTQVKAQFSEESMKKQLQFPYYTDNPVDNGALWHKSDRMENLAIQLNSDYKLLDHDAHYANIGVTGNVTPLTGAGPLVVGDITIRYAVTGIQKGAEQIDIPDGWPVKVELVQNFDGIVQASGPGLKGTQSWPISIEASTTTETK